MVPCPAWCRIVSEESDTDSSEAIKSMIALYIDLTTL
jgi:hypothetical protein